MAYICQTNIPFNIATRCEKTHLVFVYILATVVVAGVAAWVTRVATAVVVITAAKYAVVAGA